MIDQYVQQRGYRLDDWGLIPDRGTGFSLLHNFQTGCEALTVSYTMASEVCLP
jgi:hypothetical protein